MATYTAGSIPLTVNVYSAEEVDSLIEGAVKGGVQPKGSIAFASLPAPSAANVGHMYDVTDAFTTTSAWVDGAGKNYPAHTNVYVVNPSGTTYKWDALPGEGPQPATAAPAADGTAAAGTSTKFAREDHVHPTDTTRAAAADLTSHTGNTTVHVTAGERTAWNAKQAKITASGLLKGDGTGAVTAATAGEDYVTPMDLASYVPTTRTVNGHTLSSDVTISGDDIAPVLPVAETGSNNLANDVAFVHNQAGDAQSAAAAAQTTADGAASNASAALTRVGAIESAAGTLYTALNGLDPTSMTSANTIKTLVASLLSYVKAFAAASDNDNSTSYSAS